MNNLIFRKDYLINFKDLYILTKSNNIEQKALNCLKLASQSMHSFSSFKKKNKTKYDAETFDMHFYVNSLLYGSCYEISIYFSFLLKLHEIKSRLVYLKSKKKLYSKNISHVCTEVYYNNKWHFFDPTLGIYFKAKNINNILSLNEINKNIKSIIPNRNILLNKLKNNNPETTFYYKNSKIFSKPVSNYKALFDNFLYLDKKNNINDMKKAFNSKEYYFKNKNYQIKNCKYSLGFLNSRIIRSNRFLDFKNMKYTTNINKKSCFIENFPFYIIDLNIYLKNKIKKVVVNIDNKKYSINKSLKQILNHISYKNVKYPIKKIKIESETTIKKIDIIFLKSKKELLI